MKHDILEKIREHIDAHGFAVQAVFADAKKHIPGFAYTIGVYETYGHPELIIFGLPPESAHTILNEVVQKYIQADERLKTGMRYMDVLAQNLPCLFIDCAPEKAKQYALFVQDFSVDAPIMQLVWPDPAAAFPWESDFDSRYRDAQPILGNLPQ